MGGGFVSDGAVGDGEVDSGPRVEGEIDLDLDEVCIVFFLIVETLVTL